MKPTEGRLKRTMLGLLRPRRSERASSLTQSSGGLLFMSVRLGSAPLSNRICPMAFDCDDVINIAHVSIK